MLVLNWSDNLQGKPMGSGFRSNLITCEILLQCTISMVRSKVSKNQPSLLLTDILNIIEAYWTQTTRSRTCFLGSNLEPPRRWIWHLWSQPVALKTLPGVVASPDDYLQPLVSLSMIGLAAERCTDIVQSHRWRDQGHPYSCRAEIRAKRLYHTE